LVQTVPIGHGYVQPSGLSHYTAPAGARARQRLAQSDFTPATGPISDATVVVPRVLCLDGPCAGLHRGRLAQSAPMGVLSSALVVSKALHLSQKILTAPALEENMHLGEMQCIID